MSLGGGGFSTAMNNAVRDASTRGHFCISAAGNSGVDTSNSFPAAYDFSLAIGASDVNDNMASFSNHGALNDNQAPGVSTWGAASRHSSWSDGCPDRNNCFLAISGTSMACPVLAGVVARRTDFHGAGNWGNMQNWMHSTSGANNPDQLSLSVAQRFTPNRLVIKQEC